MQINLFKEVVTSVVGAQASRIVDLLYGKKNVNEFIIAKKLKLTINQTRNILYKLADEGLVSFVRKKDRKKGGWYTYFWTLNFGRGLQKLNGVVINNIANLKKGIEDKKKNQFFVCPNCHTEYPAEQALLNNYTCSECGEVLQLKDNSAEIAEAIKQVAKLEKVLSEVGGQLAEVNTAEEKVKRRKIMAESRKKTKERLARKKEKEKLEKKSGKKSKKNIKNKSSGRKTGKKKRK